jgi:hypothetical protein
MSTTAAAAPIYPVQPIGPGPLAQTARALQARLQLVFPTSRFQHDIVPAKITPEIWKQLLRRTPFIGLGWNTVDNTGDGRLFEGPGSWSVFLMVKNPASVTARYFGDSQGAGLFLLTQAAIGVLQGYTIEGLGSVHVHRAGNVYAESWDDDAAAVIVDVSVGTTLALPDLVSAPGDLNEFSQMMAEWNFGGADVLAEQLTVGDRSGG